MALWIIQIIFNVFSVVVLALFLGARRQMKDLEREVSKLRMRMDHAASQVANQASLPGPVPTDKPALEPALASTSNPMPGQLIDKRVTPTAQIRQTASTTSPYETATLLMRQGVSVIEISKRTGISVSEIQLLRRMAGAHRPQL